MLYTQSLFEMNSVIKGFKKSEFVDSSTSRVDYLLAELAITLVVTQSSSSFVDRYVLSVGVPTRSA